jgi:uncharacterized membrane protein
MKNSKKILSIIFAVIMIAAGLAHFFNPKLYLPFLPEHFPATLIIYASGVIEILFGICTMIPRYRSLGTWGILLLMLVFLPMHVVDVLKENPAIGSKEIAYGRLPLQFVLIAWAWYIHKRD